MSTTSNKPDLTNQSNVLAISQRVGASWRCLFASTDAMGQPTLVETIEVSSDRALSLNFLMQNNQLKHTPFFPAPQQFAGLQHCLT